MYEGVLIILFQWKINIAMLWSSTMSAAAITVNWRHSMVKFNAYSVLCDIDNPIRQRPRYCEAQNNF